MVSNAPTYRQLGQRRHSHAGIETTVYPAKRAFDVLMSGLITLLFLSWMIPLIGLAIKLTSPGPALFVQLRSGQNGRQFKCFKFRTMYVPQKHNDPFSQTAPNDPRVTRLGRVLRRTNLDEMPQFLNVLLGDMSLVGPRPHPLELDAEYWFALPGYPLRYGIRPGITGLAQISGCRGGITYPRMMQDRVRYDRFYIRKMSLSFDLYICFYTLTAMFRGNTDAF